MGIQSSEKVQKQLNLKQYLLKIISVIILRTNLAA